ncbi:hypothetical protein CK203_033820 [Vitis vinifera]|uniref:DUF659 domain-containing protein n=1 Tax=Vitis vinifera TaxID=29760 RepID=A0A438IQ81_VITVI|nr:hypothetical protein CK203_033820 [Vitis vinifera]
MRVLSLKQWGIVEWEWSGSGSGSESGSGSVNESGEPIPKGPMDKFAISQPRQSTLNSKWKLEERKEVCRKIGRFICSKGLSFNTVNDPYWVPMVDAIANFGPGFKPPYMHELRTWILKEEFLKSTDASNMIKNGELMFKHLDEVVEEIGEENVVQVIIDNASNYVNVGMRLMEKKEKIVVDSLCCSLHRFDVRGCWEAKCSC